MNSCDVGATPDQQQSCNSIGNAMLSSIGRIPGRSMQVGSWSWVPPGCSLQSGGDWAIHYNVLAGGAQNDATYSLICSGQAKQFRVVRSRTRPQGCSVFDDVTYFN